MLLGEKAAVDTIGFLIHMEAAGGTGSNIGYPPFPPSGISCGWNLTVTQWAGNPGDTGHRG